MVAFFCLGLQNLQSVNASPPPDQTFPNTQTKHATPDQLKNPPPSTMLTCPVV